MDEIRDLKEYYNGIMSFYNYLIFYLKGKEINEKYVMSKDFIKNAKVAFLAVFFTTEKEFLVKKNPTEEVKNNFGSKIIDDELVKSIEMIAKKNGDYYEIGDYREKNPANIIALIRNKFAHGRYHVDEDNNLVVLTDKSGDLNLELDLDKLYLLAYNVLSSLIKFPKTSSIGRIHAINKNLGNIDIDKIRSIEDAKLVLKTSRFKEYRVFTYDESDIDEASLDMFAFMLVAIKKQGEDPGIVNALVSKYREIANTMNMQISVSKKRLKDQDIDYILNNINLDELYELDLQEQIKTLLSRSVEYLEPNYRENGILNGIIHNMMLLGKMDLEEEFDFERVCKEEGFFDVIEESIVATLIAEFMALYIYPLERIYLDDNKSTIDRYNQLDFGLLDLGKFNPSKLTIYTSPLEQEEILYNSRLDVLLKKYNDLNKQKENLRKVKESGNTKAIEVLDKKIESDVLTLTELAYDTNNIINSYNIIRDDYRNNPEYYRNRAIIEGIRNAIAHGNIKIKKTNNIDNTVIIFKDIYNGEVTFELEITVDEFSSLFSQRNVSLIALFLNNRGTNKLGTLDIKRYIKE